MTARLNDQFDGVNSQLVDAYEINAPDYFRNFIVEAGDTLSVMGGLGVDEPGLGRGFILVLRNDPRAVRVQPEKRTIAVRRRRFN